MKRLITLLALLFSTSAFATNWQMIVDSSGGTRLLVEVDSVAIDSYTKADKSNGTRVYATMEFLSENEIVFTAVIDAEDCLVREAGPLLNVYTDKASNIFFWSMKGGKMYDAQGQWLCGYLQGTLENYKKQNKQNKQGTKSNKNYM